MTTGIHHVTLITRKVQANVDFYMGFLGLRLIKQTGGYEDAEQLHLFYGDRLGSPGSLISFLVWEDGAPGRTGHGQVSEVAFAVPPDSIGEWLTRAMTARIKVEGPTHEFGETVLRLRDPDGVIVKLVGVDLPGPAPLPDPIAPTRIRGVTILTETPERTADFIATFGYAGDEVQGNTRRMRSDTDIVDVRNGAGFVPSIPGTGVFDHVAFRAPDVEAVRRMRIALKGAVDITNVHDRKYFLSLYVRDPGNTLIEYATDGPGFTVDEDADHLGETLFIPPGNSARAQDLRVMLPQFSRPGAERMPQRDLHFTHRFHTPADPDGSVIVLLHGSGRNEADMMPMAHHIAPRATLLGVRGRSTEEGHPRWFRRYSDMEFDQADIRSEAAAFADFLQDAIRAYGLDADRLGVLGYSNGANFAAALMALHPGLIRRAILLRALAALDDLPAVDLSGTDVLLLTGATDPYTKGTPRLRDWLVASGAQVEPHELTAGHGPTPQDEALARDWLAHEMPKLA
ncbi:VOC family protein [Paracoccus sp. DMF-8]|uniref:VOC family protein n=1 Tax=Paracoccus sp. DMF-8 TaxID=3019445 RepID=UPI0023E7851F|nr:VOC family protein [Paracoccus sp. DMF-8]MDF3605970.1 VOC family protein [Paracoccus sp. DMF-8]